MGRKLTKEEFVQKARKVHGDKYDYSKVEYINNRTKICIICPKHGEFWQLPKVHLKGDDCMQCGIEKRSKKNTYTTEVFIEKARKVHGDKYDYSKVEYINNKSKICIICPIHGEFTQTPKNHLIGEGCPICANLYKQEQQKKDTNYFIKKAKTIHGDKYDYSKVEYVNNHTKVCIICPKHGEFWQTPHQHYFGLGCKRCVNENYDRNKLFEIFVQKARQVHGDTYDYSKVKYLNGKTKISIICPKHGEFWQTPNCHLNGRGCPHCNASKLETTVKTILDEEKLSYVYNKRYSWLNGLSLDFYLPQYNIAIECQGEQHFKPIEYFGGEKGFQKILKRDIIKKKICEEKGIKLLYFTNCIKTLYPTINGENQLLKEIKLRMN